MSSGLHEKFNDAGNSGTALTVNLDNGSTQKITLTGNCTLSLSNPPASGKAYALTLMLYQDATGSRTVTWPASFKWPSNTAPTLTTTASKYDVVSAFTVDGGTTWVAGLVGKTYG